MAKVKIKIGENEVEIESRDFYVDNQTMGDVIDTISQHILENRAQISYETEKSHADEEPQFNQIDANCLNYLDDAEVHEPEFSEPIQLTAKEIKSKLETLSKNSFFNSPRTVSETVNQLREYGWSVSSLDVSKTLSKMASTKEILKSLQKNASYYSLQEPILIN